MLGRRLTRKLNVRVASKGSAGNLPADAVAPGTPADRRTAPATFEVLEDRRLMSVDPLAHVAKVQTLPYVLEFNAPVEGLHDADGQDIGLTRGDIEHLTF